MNGIEIEVVEDENNAGIIIKEIGKEIEGNS